MSGIQRLLSKREKRGESPSTRKRLSMYLSSTPTNHSTANKSSEAVNPDSVADFHGLFADTGRPNSAEEPKVRTLRQRIAISKSVLVKNDNILWSLRCNYSKGDVESATELISAMTDAAVGIVIPYDPKVQLLGAVNRQAVTCFLDAVLFAMFSRLDSFEAMLYNNFEDQPRNRLAFLLRLWVNLLRAGKLISTDITMNIQETLAECGWDEAKKMHQQDASEAFTFITEKLQLPLLTLKMDMYHAGKQDADDHRFINERLLEVAIPAGENGEHKDINLEDCLEDYFNNRIEVRRFLERRSTFNLKTSMDWPSKDAKANAIHIETTELEDSDTPLTPVTPRMSHATQRPGNRSRAQSIIQERFVPNSDETTKFPVINGIATNEAANANNIEHAGRQRGGSVRKEVLMPAWQFFSLIPWYTNNLPSNDAQVADHFSAKRPIIGLCLKRYSFTPQGKAIRLDTFVDIPVEIGLPHFIQDDKLDDKGPLYGEFKLSLQSVVCHRGNSVDSGHYISLVRASSSTSPGADSDYWMRFDDLAAQKVTMIDIHQALRDETPYLVFYQIVPIEGETIRLTQTSSSEKPPSYAESQLPDSGVSNVSGSPELERSASFARSVSGSQASSQSPSQPPSLPSSRPPSQPTSNRPSCELPRLDDHRATIMPSEKRRPSTTLFAGSTSIGQSSRSNSQDDSRRASTSISRSISRGSLHITKTLASIGLANKAKEDRPMSMISEPKMSAEEVGGTPEDALARLTGEVPDNAPARNESIVTENGRGRSHKRHKDKHRLTKLYLGQQKPEKPDRECAVM